MRECKVRFLSHDKSVIVPQGTDILSAAAKAGIILNASCAGEGLCGKCRVIINRGEVKRDESALVSDKDRAKGVVLACQSLIEGDLEVTVAKEALLTQKAVNKTEDFTKGVILEREKSLKFLPIVIKICLQLNPPTAADSTGDFDRIIDAIKYKTNIINISTRLSNIQHLSQVVRDSDFKVSVTLLRVPGALEIISIEPGDTSQSNFALAFDIGTTTIVGQLIDLKSNTILGTRIVFNKQAIYGADIITRIVFASEPDGLKKLSQAVRENINEIISDLASDGNIAASDIYAVVLAGNMTMMHLLLNIDPTNIRKAPYIPTSTSFPVVRASEIGIAINPRGVSAFIPGVTTYVGGDIVAGVQACGVAENEYMTMLVDIGTNGEIVLGNREWMIGAAASAGPAFEGSGLLCGMKAVDGAIQKVSIDGNFDLRLDMVGSSAPKGICGSGYIDLLHQMLKRGIIGKDGKIRRDLGSRRIRKGEDSYEFVVAYKDEAATDHDVVINEDDIDNLKRSKGAIYSAIISLLKKIEKNISEVKKIYIAGGFGNYLNIENSIAIGLLPDIDRNVYQFVGNSSLAGARMSLISEEAYTKTEAIHKNITYIDLSAEADYMNEYIAALFFPHTDMTRFPSVVV